MESTAETARSIAAYGVSGDGTTVETDRIQSALIDCAESGGVLSFPPGEYLTGPLTVGSNTTIEIQSGATLRFVRDLTAFPSVESRWEGWDQTGFHPCLWIDTASNVTIRGGGVIDGQGSYWWQYTDMAPGDRPATLTDRLEEFEQANDKSDTVSSFTLRPPLCQIHRSSDVSISGVTLRNSPFWNTHVVYSDDVVLTDLRIENPADAPNGDGIDIDSSTHVHVSDTFIDAGDDAICIKSGKDEEGRQIGRAAEKITVTNCTVEAGHGGVVIGSEMSGDVRDVVVSNCTFTDTDRGIRIKTQRGRGGVVEDCRFSTIVMRRVACPFVINGYYFMDIDADPQPVDGTTPLVRRIHFTDITATNVESAGFLAGIPEQPFGPITLTNVDISATRSLDATGLSPAMTEGYEQQHGLFAKSLCELGVRDVRLRVADGPLMALQAAETVTIDGLDVPRGSTDIDLANVEQATLRNARLPATTRISQRGESPALLRIDDDIETAIESADSTELTVERT
ncbi:glycoside hydrolase family 28 protein [Halocatena halophila]|uniref:glycoside hydrolase family 28 protein n=1 Tax=Halocatena halophila TaxID=2814576 RepID=UPI002ED316E5